jgi:hypothetical protein
VLAARIPSTGSEMGEEEKEGEEGGRSFRNWT